MPQISSEGTFKGTGPSSRPVQVHTIRGTFDANIVRDMKLLAARGDLGGVYTVHVEGENPDIDVASGYEDLWGGGGAITYPTSAETLNIVSSSANDDGSPAGTGAQTVRVTYLDSSWTLTTEDIAMNGTTSTNLATTAMRGLEIKTMVVGSVGTNDGSLRIRNVTTNRIVSMAGDGISRFGSYTIPANKTGFVTSWWFGVNNGIDADVVCKLSASTNGEGWLIHKKFGASFVTSGAMRPIYMPIESYIVLSEKTDVRLSATASVDNTSVAGGFTLIVVDD